MIVAGYHAAFLPLIWKCVFLDSFHEDGETEGEQEDGVHQGPNNLQQQESSVNTELHKGHNNLQQENSVLQRTNNLRQQHHSVPKTSNINSKNNNLFDLKIIRNFF